MTGNTPKAKRRTTNNTSTKKKVQTGKTVPQGNKLERNKNRWTNQYGNDKTYTTMKKTGVK
jgi:hypothetical protein